LLTSDHEYTDPYERPSWGGLVLYLNTIMKWCGVTPKSNLYFDKSDLSPKKIRLDYIWVIEIKPPWD
jgi:hypothetical protein